MRNQSINMLFLTFIVDFLFKYVNINILNKGEHKMAFKINYKKTDGTYTQMNFTKNEMLLMRSVVKLVRPDVTPRFITPVFIQVLIKNIIQSEADLYGQDFEKVIFIIQFSTAVQFRISSWDAIDTAYQKKLDSL